MLSNFSRLLVIQSDWALLALRLAVGLILMAHGWPKIKDLKATASNFEMMGFHPGSLWGSAAAIVEFVGGFLLIVGLFVQCIALIVCGEFIVITFWRIRRHNPFVGGSELDVLILASSLVLLAFGGGMFSLVAGRFGF